MVIKVVVIGPTGFTGSQVCRTPEESSATVLERGALVTGLSRNPATLGVHPNYTPLAVDLNRITPKELAEHFKGHSAVVNAFGPHSTHHLAYSPFVEVCRKVVLAVKQLHNVYLLQVGGTGSLHFRVKPQAGIAADGTEYEHGFDGDIVDSNTFWRLYHETLASNVAHCKYLDEILPPVGTMLQSYMKVSDKRKTGKELSREEEAILSKFEGYADMVEPPPVVTFVKACRAVLMFYEGQKSFDWTFVSPPPNYFPCSSTGTYTISPEPYAALKEDGHFTGISSGDLALAIVDELENRDLIGKHWTLYSDVPNDGQVVESYWRLPQ